MRKITPYKTFDGLSAAVDNGGRWWNLFSKAGDGKITESELAAAGGNTRQQESAFLFLALASSRLPDDDIKRLNAQMELPLRLKNQRHQPSVLRPSQVEEQATDGALVLLEGRCVKQLRLSNLTISMPVFVRGNVSGLPRWTKEQVPLMTKMRIYEFADVDGGSSATTLLGCKPGQALPTDRPIHVACLVHGLGFSGERPSHHFICEGHYYTDAVSGS